MSNNTSLIAFKAICNFINELDEVFGAKLQPLKLYALLLGKTTIAHDKPIQKHIEAFRSFCVANRDAVIDKDPAKIVIGEIVYSDRCTIDMKKIFEMADKQTAGVIWTHLLTIFAVVDPTGKARQILKESSNNGSGVEANFLTDIIGKVEQHVDPNANPMEAISSIMQSGIFNDLVGGMGNGLQDGTLDLGKLMGTVQNMVTSLGEQAGEGDETMNAINTMMGNLSAGVEAAQKGDTSTPPPDLTSLLGPMMGALSGNMAGAMDMPDTGDGMSIEDQINAKLEEAKKSGALGGKKKEE